ncbi:MAG TPA: PIN domain-containing protein [Actinophytocola sp.]|jgi:predicted nucleic acid-binding protein|uniref:PIN domain-containing protein n=1 Tax=Actinophytocola sp. TaxID=1872138 RepID=UPI002DFCCE16|nr:PIN domain-containing protein [Actinophytocola sp.]
MSSNTDRSFIDTNILLYAHDQRDPGKQEIAQALLRKLWRDRTGVLSTQVLIEFYNTATQKLKPAMSKSEARAIMTDYGTWCSSNTSPLQLVWASSLQERYSTSWWDALIIEAAMRSGAKTLLSEDMQHGQTFGLLTVRNPFVEN